MYGISSLAQRMVDAVTMGGTITTHVFKKFTDPARTGRDARPPRLVDSLHSMGLQSSAPASGIPAAAHHGPEGESNWRALWPLREPRVRVAFRSPGKERLKDKVDERWRLHSGPTVARGLKQEDRQRQPAQNHEAPPFF